MGNNVSKVIHVKGLLSIHIDIVDMEPIIQKDYNIRCYDWVHNEDSLNIKEIEMLKARGE